MDIKKKIHIVVFVFITIFITACKPKNYFKIKNEVYDVKVLIRGPGSCTHIILYNLDGKGKIIRGRTNDDYTKDFKKFYIVEFMSYFEIKETNELNDINTIIKEIESLDLNSNSYFLDSRRKEMYIKGKKKFDVYGWNGEQLIDYLRLLMPYLPYDVNSSCTSSSGILVETN